MAIKNFVLFDAKMKRIEGNIPVRTQRFIVATLRKLGSELGERTPIDTGQAVSSWEPWIDRPILISGKPKVISKSRRQVARKVGQKFSGVRLVGSTRFTPAQKLGIANGQPYIEALDQGYSPQAPAGFSKQAVNAVRLWAERKGTSYFVRLDQ